MSNNEMLSNRQQILLDTIQKKGTTHVGQLQGIYTEGMSLKRALVRLERLGLIKRVNYNHFVYVGEGEQDE